MFNLRRTPFSSITAKLSESHATLTLLSHTVGDRLDFGSATLNFTGLQAAFGVYEMGCEDGIYQC